MPSVAFPVKERTSVISTGSLSTSVALMQAFNVTSSSVEKYSVSTGFNTVSVMTGGSLTGVTSIITIIESQRLGTELSQTNTFPTSSPTKSGSGTKLKHRSPVGDTSIV